MANGSSADLQFELPLLPDSVGAESVEEIYKQGFLAEGVERFAWAASCFEEVRRRQPNNPYVLLDLARVYFQLFEIERAKSVLGEAAERAGQDAELWYEIALAYQEARLDAEAEHCFQLARQEGAGNTALAAAQIAFYESRGRLPEAQAQLEQVLQQGATGGLIAGVKGVVWLRMGNYPAAIEALAACLSELPEANPYHAYASYALARALAESGQEAASWECLRQVKARQKARPDAQRCWQIHETVTNFRAQARSALEATDVRDRWRAETGAKRRPLVFLLGYPRSGTTLLEQVVESHSAIHGLEETGAFIQATQKVFGRPLLPGEKPWDVIDKADAACCELARDWYFEYLHRLGAPREESVLLLDKNPGLTGHVHIISRLFPAAKFLVMLRDPRDICLSAFQTPVVLSPFSVNWLQWESTVKHCAEILNHWVALRDRLPNPYLEVRYEDLISNLPQTGRKVMKFLGLEWEPAQENFANHARSKPVYSPTRYEVQQGLSSKACGKWRRFGLDYSAAELGFTSLLERLGYEADHNRQRPATIPSLLAAAAGGGGGLQFRPGSSGTAGF